MAASARSAGSVRPVARHSQSKPAGTASARYQVPRSACDTASVAMLWLTCHPRCPSQAAQQDAFLAWQAQRNMQQQQQDADTTGEPFSCNCALACLLEPVGTLSLRCNAARGAQTGHS